jgi:hypothetical protein
MASSVPTTSRRALLGALVGTAALAGSIGAGIAAPAEAATVAEPDRYETGRKTGEEIALRHMARAWIDRWKAAGGDFGLSGSRVIFGNVESYIWEPSDHGRADLAPHVWLTEPEQQRGAIKALEGLLTLTPGLKDAVRGIVGVQLLTAAEA